MPASVILPELATSARVPEKTLPSGRFTGLFKALNSTHNVGAQEN